ncbi:hypothetical protein ACFL0V_04965 [Nanoarchaeota archaeon]
MKLLIALLFILIIACTPAPQPVAIDLTEDIEDNTTSPTTVEQAPIPESEIEPEPKTVSPTPKPVELDQDRARELANLFATSWKSKQYSMMYSLFTDDLKNKKTIDEFNAVMKINPSFSRVSDVNIKKLDFQDTFGLLTLQVTTHVSSYDQELKMIYKDAWKLEGFDELFLINTFSAACPYFKEYNKATCANTLALQLKDHTYCERAACKYKTCIASTRGPLSNKEEVEFCNICPPVGKTTKECIVELAITKDKPEICNEIDEDYYNDRYCICWGSYARSKGNSGYCNMIDPSYKDLCIKGFEGRFC